MLLIRKSITPIASLGMLLLLVYATANSVSLAETQQQELEQELELEQEQEQRDANITYATMNETQSLMGNEMRHSRKVRQILRDDPKNQMGTCAPGLVLPLWMPQINISIGDRAIRGLVYFLFMVYLFVGVSIISDRFMGAIEAITSIERTVKVKTPDGRKQEMRVRVWNETVANLTLMALGSSAPEILLSVIEIYAKDFESGDLGPGTIVGSAAYNLFVIIALCMVLIPKGEVRRIKHLRVFIVTAIFSVFAYIWLWIILSIFSPGIIEVWESLITLLMFPIIVLWAYIAERRLLVYKYMDKKYRVNKRGTVVTGEHSSESDPERLGAIGSDLNQYADVRRDYVAVLAELRQKYPDADLEQLEMMAQEQVMSRGSKSRAFYRIQATRKLIGSSNLHRKAQDRNSDLADVAMPGSDDENEPTCVYFEPGHYTVMENCGEFEVRVVRRGDISKYSEVEYETQDGTASAGSDYVGKRGVLSFPPGVDEQRFKIEIIDDDIFEEDECFYIKLFNASKDTQILIPQLATVMILDDDHAGIFAFTQTHMEVTESVGICDLLVMRYSGARGVVKVPYWTEDDTAIAGVHYQAVQGELTFTNNMTEQFIAIPIIEESSYEKKVSFIVHMGTPELAPDDELLEKIQELEKRPYQELNDLERIMLMSRPRSGDINGIKVTIRESSEFKATVDKLVSKAQVSPLGTSTWKEQFKDALTVVVDDGSYEPEQVPKCLDYICHFLSLFWKVLFAFVPPTDVCGGYLTFGISIFIIGVITALIGDAATYFGCALNIKDSVTAICFVALGTSIPDTFASIIASKQDETADNCIGNVTGSNAVNVFLGIGLAWTLASIYHMSNGSTFNVEPGTIGFAVALFCGEALIAIGIMMYRRLNSSIKAELGGPSPAKWIHASILFSLWIIYLTISTLEAYHIIKI